MAVPYTFATATGSIPLSQLDTNFATGIIIGNTTVTLGDTITTINNLTLANVTVTSASFSNVTLTGSTNVASTTTVFSGTGARIQGDFSNATLADRTAFQDKTTNNATSIYSLPNGSSTDAGFAAFNNSNPTNAAWIGIDTATGVTRLISTATGSGTALPLTINVGAGGAEAARFSTNGNFGINTSSPVAKLDVFGPSGVTSFTGTTKLGVTVRGSTGAADYSGVDFTGNGQTTPQARIAVLSTAGGSTLNFGTSNNYTLGITNLAMTIDEFGRLLLGTTNSGFGGSGGNAKLIPTAAANTGIATGTWNNVGQAIDFFANIGATAVYSGSVSLSGATTTYGSASDYRLKSNPQPLTGSGAFIDALQPKTWTWTGDGQRGVGFIAHEVASVSPTSVVGDKDAVDTNGNPKYQSLAYGSAEFIANIVAELQSLRARVAALESA